MEDIIHLDNPQVYLTTNNSGIVTYHINGDKLYCLNKRDCEYRIRRLWRAGYYNAEMREILISQLKALKRP